MKRTSKILIVIALAAAVGAVIVVKKKPAPAPALTEGLPRLVDLGRGLCLPCKMMAPVLEELRAEYASSLHVEIIDIGDHPEATMAYNVRTIPTQLFMDAQGNELFRHEGFMPKEDILKKWKELGVTLHSSGETQMK